MTPICCIKLNKIPGGVTNLYPNKLLGKLSI